MSLTVLTLPIPLKRGTKRPSAVMSLSDSEDNNPSPKTKPRVSASSLPSRPSSPGNGIKIKKGVLLSDDEEESPQKVKSKAVIKQKGKGRVSVAQEEEEDEDGVGPSTRAMMDLDCVSSLPLCYAHFCNALTVL